MLPNYEALLVVSFGGPEKPEDVMPFLENVTRGRGIPRERLEEVAEHYYHFGGKSPINDQNRDLIAALRDAGVKVPIYWGNRNWHPMLEETVQQMKVDGVRYAAAFITSAYGSYSGCRQYREDIARAMETVGDGAPDICVLEKFWKDPGLIEPVTERVGEALAKFDERPHVVFTAHSIPMSMASTSPYVEQLRESASLVATRLGIEGWELVYQSRSGPPTQPWLEPDILDYIRDFHAKGGRNLVISPIGFVSDHMEVLFDLDTEAAELCAELGVRMERAGTVGTHPKFIRMIVDQLSRPCRVCMPDCCPRPVRPTPVRTPVAG